MNGLERITVHLPQAGMGSDLDPSLFTIDALGIPSFCINICNITFSGLGWGSVRYGCQYLDNIPEDFVSARVGTSGSEYELAEGISGYKPGDDSYKLHLTEYNIAKMWRMPASRSASQHYKNNIALVAYVDCFFQVDAHWSTISYIGAPRPEDNSSAPTIIIINLPILGEQKNVTYCFRPGVKIKIHVNYFASVDAEGEKDYYFTIAAITHPQAPMPNPAFSYTCLHCIEETPQELIKAKLQNSINSNASGSLHIQAGILCKYEAYKGSHAWSLLYNEVLVSGVIPQAIFFSKNLIITNGTNNILKYDGEECSPIYQWVKETFSSSSKGAKITKAELADSNNLYIISFKCSNNQFAQKWKTESSVFLLGTEYYIDKATVSSSSVRLLITGEPEKIQKLTQYNEAYVSEIFFKRFPPKCNYLFVNNQYIYGLGPNAPTELADIEDAGPFGSEGSREVPINYKTGANINFRSEEERLKVYRTTTASSISKWIDEKTQDYMFVNMSDYHGEYDNFEAIVSLSSDSVLFMGRKRSQLWTLEPKTNEFGSFVKIMNVGIIHPAFVWSIGNNIYCISNSGLQFVNTLNLANEPAVSSTSLINKQISNDIRDTMNSYSKYLRYSVSIYNSGSFILIDIGKEYKYYISFTDTLRFYGTFSGLFSGSQCDVIENKLLLAKGSRLYYYADGLDGEHPQYDDDGQSICATWLQPIPNIRVGWKNYRVLLNALYDNDFVSVPKSNNVTVTMYSTLYTNRMTQIKLELKQEQYLKIRQKANGTHTSTEHAFSFVKNKDYKTLSHLCRISGKEIMFNVSITTKYRFVIRDVSFWGCRYN